MSTTIDIQINHDAWSAHQGIVENALHKALTHLNIADRDYEISVLLTDDAHIKVLNANYRHINKATNVLSFPQDDEVLLGDIVLAYETIVQEAEDQQKSFHDHLTHLSVHGLLHLLGYDHETDEEAQEMEALEIEILDAMGIKNPYAD